MRGRAWRGQDFPVSLSHLCTQTDRNARGNCARNLKRNSNELRSGAWSPEIQSDAFHRGQSWWCIKASQSFPNLPPGSCSRMAPKISTPVWSVTTCTTNEKCICLIDNMLMWLLFVISWKWQQVCTWMEKNPAVFSHICLSLLALGGFWSSPCEIFTKDWWL